MSSRGLGLVFGLALLVAAVALWPLRLALLPGLGVAAAGVSGTVWRGELRGAQWGGLALGDAAAGLSPVSVLAFAPMLQVRGEAVSGRVSQGGISEFSGRVRGLGPGLGEIQMEGLVLHFASGACVEASGRVVLRQNGQTLAGVPRCAGAAAELALARPDGVVVATLRLGAEGLARLP